MNCWLKIEPRRNAIEPWGIICFNNSNSAGDLVSKRNTNRFILYVLGILVSWQSKKSLSLSSSEAEYITIYETVMEVMFVHQFLKSMNI